MRSNGNSKRLQVIRNVHLLEGGRVENINGNTATFHPYTLAKKADIEFSKKKMIISIIDGLSNNATKKRVDHFGVE